MNKIKIQQILLFTSVPFVASAATLSQSTSSFGIVDDFTSIGDGALLTYDGNGFTLGEAFAGDTVTTEPGPSEAITATPSNPLSLNSAPVGDSIFGVTSLGVVTGQIEDTPMNDLPRGAISILFDEDITEFGLSLFGVDGFDRTATFYVFNSDGTLQSSFIEIFGSAATNIDYRISSASAFRGITITNDDISGIGVDNFRLSSVPEVSSFSAVAGLLAFSCTLLRRKGRS